MFNTELVITWLPNTSGLPPDANPAWEPITDLIGTKVSEMKSANLLGDLISANSVTILNFVNTTAATEYQNYLTGVLSDFNMAIPGFEIIENT